jgi:c-di-GMP-binding flagellar brake protein YcgR
MTITQIYVRLKTSLNEALKSSGKQLGKAHPRRYPRLSVRVAVDYTVGEKCFRGVANTLSGGGLFLTNVDGLELGKEISVRFRPARHLPVIQAKASVRYIVAGQGAAVEFTEISADDRHRLLRLIHQKTGDRRILPRAPLATQVQSDQCMSLAFSRDISLGGMFIETNTPLPVGSPLTVRFNLDHKDRVVTATAHVAYHVEKMGMGVLFTAIGPQDHAAIQEYVESLPALPRTKSATNTSA